MFNSFFRALPKASVILAASMSLAGLLHGAENTLAVPLLAAPINATWAANYAEEWHDKGFRGFLFEGILDDLSLFPSEQEWVEPTSAGEAENTGALVSAPYHEGAFIQTGGMVVPGDWDDLIREIGGANNRLRAVGVDRNFLHMRLAPERAWFSNPLLLAVAERRFRLAGEFCRAARLRGIAVDTQSDSFIYDYRWDGYASDGSPESLAEGAYRFGLRALRAFIRAFPEGEILLLSGDADSSGPLWFDFAQGARHAPGAADGVPVRFVFLEPVRNHEPTHFRCYADRFATLLDQRGAVRSSSHVRRPVDGVAFALEPIHYEGDIPAARYSVEAYRNALYAAALYGSGYVLVWAPAGGWWQIPPDIADQFEHLKQGGAARVRFAPPVPRTLDVYAPRLHGADAVYMGPTMVQGLEAEVLKTETGAAVLLWEGTQDEMRLPSRAGMVTGTNLVTDERMYLTPREEQVTIPKLPGPVLLEGMRLRDFALPASLHLEITPAIRAGITRAEAVVGIHNPLAAPLRGALTLVGGARYALGSAGFPLALEPGKSSTFRRTLRGISHLGTRPEFLLNLSIAADAPLVRLFVFSVAPEEVFAWFSDASLTGPPLVFQRDDLDPGTLMFSGDARGRVTCYSPQGKHEVWSRRLSGGYRLPAVLVTDSRGEPHIAVASEQGRLRILDAASEERTVILADGQSIDALASLRGREKGQGDLIVVGRGGTASFHTAMGALVNRVEAPGAITHLLTANTLPDRVIAVASATALIPDEKAPSGGGESTQVMSLDGEGRRQWIVPLPRAISCPPALVHIPSTGDHVVCFADASGGLTCLNARDGAPVLKVAGGQGGPALQLTGAQDVFTGGSRVYLTLHDRLTSMPLLFGEPPENESESWTVNLAQPTALAALPGAEGVLVGTADGSVYALKHSGDLLWEDHNGTGAAIHFAFLPLPDAGDAYICLIAGADHSVRALRVRRDLLPETPLRLNPLSPPR